MWPFRRAVKAPQRPDYNYIRQLELELGIGAPAPIVQSGQMTQEEWFEFCRTVPSVKNNPDVKRY